MTALVGLMIGMVIGIACRELWALHGRHKEPSPEEMQRICRELASETADDVERTALLSLAENYRRHFSTPTRRSSSCSLQAARNR